MKLWKKAVAAVTAGVLCVGSVGVTGLQGVLESVGTVLTASAEGGVTVRADTKPVPVSTGTITVRAGAGTAQLTYNVYADDTIVITNCECCWRFGNSGRN